MNEVMETEVLETETEEMVLEIEGEVVENTEVTATEATVETSEKGFNFNPGAFVDNLSYMGLGMLGIFVVIGVIIIVTSLLSKIKSKDAE